MLGKIIPVMAALAIGGSVASADILWSNRGATVNDATFQPDAPFVSGWLEDGTFPSAFPRSVESVIVGYYNDSQTSQNVDLLVSFFDTMNYGGAGTAAVNSSPIGPQYRFNLTAPAGNNGGGFVTFGETSLLSLTGGPLLFPDANFGMSIKYVLPNTNTLSTIVKPLFKDIPTTVGTSNELDVVDLNHDDIFIVDEAFSWEEPPFPAANVYFELQGTVVPEPASLGMLALVGLGALRRRR